jgi:hypothetical protein
VFVVLVLWPLLSRKIHSLTRGDLPVGWCGHVIEIPGMRHIVAFVLTFSLVFAGNLPTAAPEQNRFSSERCDMKPF